jgi:hypothetical protein
MDKEASLGLVLAIIKAGHPFLMIKLFSNALPERWSKDTSAF